jgi:predicted negative regulator of RcsB-dependent stress response
MSSFLNVSVLVLATMVLVLAGMVGYMYWQQNKVMTAVSSLSSFVASQFVPAPLEVHDSETEEEDDRASVVEEKPVEVVDKVEMPTVAEVKQETDVDDLQTKTSAELRDLLSKKGIPYGKRDSKSVLLELLKASA